MHVEVYILTVNRRADMWPFCFVYKLNTRVYFNWFYSADIECFRNDGWFNLCKQVFFE